MVKAMLAILLMNCINLAYSQENIVFNRLRKLTPNEIFVAEARRIENNERYYRFTINIKSETCIEKVLEFKNTEDIYMFQDKKRFLAYLDTTGWNKSSNDFILSDYGNDPLFYIDGREGTIEYVGSSFGGFFILEESMVLINRIPMSNSQITTDLYVYSILEKKILSTLDVNKYIRSKVQIDNRDHFYVSFIGYRDYTVPVNNGYIKIGLDHYGENGPKSFFAYLNVKDVYNLTIEDMQISVVSTN